MQRTQIYLQKTQTIKLKNLAQEKNVTVSEIIRNLINKNIPTVRQKSKGRSLTLLQIAKRVEKLGEKGPRDLSKNMDKYLYGKI